MQGAEFTRVPTLERQTLGHRVRLSPAVCEAQGAPAERNCTGLRKLRVEDSPEEDRNVLEVVQQHHSCLPPSVGKPCSSVKSLTPNWGFAGPHSRGHGNTSVILEWVTMATQDSLHRNQRCCKIQKPRNRGSSVHTHWTAMKMRHRKKEREEKIRT